LNQAAINGIRASGATTQYIFVEGNAYSSAQQWASVSSKLSTLKDPNNLIVYEMHQYLDSDNSGTHDPCVSTSVGVDRVSSATNWLKQNNKLGVLGEFAGGANSQCMTAVKNLLDHMHQNSNVWLGALWWAAGPWWADYMYSFEPPNGKAYVYYKSTLQNYLPGK
jgi:endoglucanase